MRADRLLSLLDLLRRHGRLSAAELARRLEVDPRTVMRDIDALSSSGVPVYAERGRNGGYQLLPGFTPDVDGLTMDEARALFVAGGRTVTEALGLGGQFSSALRKLSARLPDDHHREVSHALERIVIDGANWTFEPSRLPHLAEVQDAVFSDRRVVIGYTSRMATSSGSRTIDPYGLLMAAGTWYLLAGHRGQPRSYRVDRIDSVRMLDQPANRPPDLDLRKLWQQMRAEYADQPRAEVRLSISPSQISLVRRMLSMVLTGSPTHVEEGDRVVFTAQVRSIDGTAALLVGFGNQITVLSPPDLKDRMVAIASEVQTMYAAQAGDRPSR